MLDVVIIAIGKIKQSQYAEMILEYQKRLRPYIRLKVVELSAEKFGSSDKVQAKTTEGQKIVKALDKYENSLVLALAENGAEMDSPKLAEYLDKQGRQIVFVLGGALGLSNEVYDRADAVASLSKLTFPHELARVVLCEQLYRAGTILKGKTYHY